MFLELVMFIILLLLLALSAYNLHKTRRVHLMQYELKQQQEILANTQYQQIQSFIGLNQLLQLSWPLPVLRGWAASPDFLLLLAENALQYKPEVMVECSSGSSTVVLAQCAKLNGKGQVLSLEHDEKYAEKTRQELIKQGLQDWATVIHAPLQNYVFNDQDYLWYTLNENIRSQQIDMLVIDGPPGGLNQYARYPAGPLLLPLLNKNAAVFLDDADRPDEQEVIKRWIDEYSYLECKQCYCEKGAVRLNN